MGTKNTEHNTTSTPEGNTGEAPKQKNTTPKQEPDTSQGKKEGNGGEKVLTQEQVNELLGKVRSEGREAGQTAILKELGVKSVDDLKNALETLKKIEREKLTEEERLKADLKSARQRVAEMQEVSQQAAKKAQDATINAEIVRLAAGRFASVDAVLKLVDREQIKITDDGTIEGVSKALDALAEAYPFTLQKAGSKVSLANPKGPTTAKERTDEERRTQYFGMSGSNFWEGGKVRKIVELE